MRSDSADQPKAKFVLNSIRPSAGGGAGNGIRWLDNAHGGGGDAAWIQWVSEDGENTALRIGVANDDVTTLSFTLRRQSDSRDLSESHWASLGKIHTVVMVISRISAGSVTERETTPPAVHVGNDADDNLSCEHRAGSILSADCV